VRTAVPCSIDVKRVTGMDELFTESALHAERFHGDVVPTLAGHCSSIANIDVEGQTVPSVPRANVATLVKNAG
jgi:hypothetical protein